MITENSVYLIKVKSYTYNFLCNFFVKRYLINMIKNKIKIPFWLFLFKNNNEVYNENFDKLKFISFLIKKKTIIVLLNNKPSKVFLDENNHIKIEEINDYLII